MIVEYNSQRVFMGSLDLVDPGNTCIRAISGDGAEYYIFTKTIAGKISLLKVGPVLDGLEEFLDGFEVSYRKFDYKEATIAKEFKNYINDPKKKIQIVEEILPEEAYDIVPNIAETFKNID